MKKFILFCMMLIAFTISINVEAQEIQDKSFGIEKIQVQNQTTVMPVMIVQNNPIHYQAPVGPWTDISQNQFIYLPPGNGSSPIMFSTIRSNSITTIITNNPPNLSNQSGSGNPAKTPRGSLRW